MPLQQIREQILKEAEEKAKAIEESGRRESEKIVRDANEQAKGIREKAAAAARQWAEVFIVEHEAEFKIDRHNALLGAQEEAIEANIGPVIRAITFELSKNVGKVADGAADALEKATLLDRKDFVIRCEEKHMRLMKGVGIKTEPSKRGIRLETGDGSVSIDISPAAIVRRNTDSIRMALVKELFGGTVALEKKMGKEEKDSEKRVEEELEKAAGKKKEEPQTRKKKGKEKKRAAKKRGR